MKARLPYRTLAVAAACAAATGALSALRYDRAAILGGEAWRLLSGHMVHASPTHLVWDVAGLFAVGLLFEESLGTRYFTVLLVSALTISFGLLLFDTSLVAYCGLSGVLNGLWVAGSLAAADRERTSGRTVLAWFYAGCLGVLVLKLGVESVVGQGVLTDPASLGADPVPHAHVLGALGGLLAAVALPGSSYNPGVEDDRLPQATA